MKKILNKIKCTFLKFFNLCKYCKKDEKPIIEPSYPKNHTTTLKFKRVTKEALMVADIIPEDGEPIVEVCENGVRLLKIGNGYSRYSELPYIGKRGEINCSKIKNS